MKRLDSYSIELFRLLAESGSFARAAEHAHLDATALSRRITQLEHTLGAKLVIRSRNGTSLTASGRRLYARSLELDRLLTSIANDISGSEDQLHGEITLGINPSAMLSFAPGFIVSIQKKWPGLRLRIKEASSPEVVDLVARSAIDIGVGSPTPSGRGIHRTELIPDRLTFVLSEGHPLTELPQLSFVDSLGYPYVICQTGAGIDMVLIEQARKLGKRFPAAQVVQSYDFVFKLVSVGLGISIVPRLALQGFPAIPHVVERPLAEEWAVRSLCMYTAWSEAPDKLTRVVAAEMKRYCKEVYAASSLNEGAAFSTG